MIVVIGGGPAGRFAAGRLGQAGREVTLVEREAIGGQCLNSGCMQVCALNDAARVMERAGDFAAAGVLDGAPHLDFSALLCEMGEVQRTIRRVLERETRAAGVEVRYGATARVDGRRVFIDDEEVEAEAVVIATGSAPAVPDLPGTGLASVYTARTLHTMPALPEHLVIAGGGVSAAEFAYIFSRLGSRVTVLARREFLGGLDPRLRRLALKELSGVEVREHTPLTGITGTSEADGAAFGGAAPGACQADAVLLAVGLVPQTAMVAGVEKGSHGEILVDGRMQTSVTGVYAAGDAAGPPYLTPIARLQGVVAAENILGHEMRYAPQAVPQALALANDLAFCLGDDGDDGIALSLPAPAGPGSFWSVPKGDTGLGKILVDPETGALRSVWAASPGAGITATYLAEAMRRKKTVFDLEDLIDVHPLAEGVHGLFAQAARVIRERDAEKEDPKSGPGER
ncbi:NAD(P)/FAD-dependent oxidoreductase [Methanofollis formosanus]|uniref:NAD(P)/FAD-dependent oxidoreductase n=1 Tax=Methanofollis formosanus TaxID=299308 RepID=A0A8G1A3W8_9EURY|nr:NAD(P)/FAD-dependent oxidoreductase [Methanofollis formosanus]QYZ79617.1 NAD(P)/FAD-dependent oxidoreductase [Methanofollis formosanus]